jgi:DNA-binding transcriptional LysR family regulator
VELSVICEPSPNLDALIRRGALDIALVTQNDEVRHSEVVRREPLLWVCSANHSTHEAEVLPMAFGRPGCIWRQAACDMLESMGRDYRVLFTSWSATVVAAAVLSGLAISVLPECALRPGMRVLGEADGFGRLPECQIGIMRGHTGHTEIVEALARHIAESLDNISVPTPDETGSFDFAAFTAARGRRLKPSHVLPGW